MQKLRDEADHARTTRVACVLLAAGAFVLAFIFFVEYRFSPDRRRLSRSGCTRIRAIVLGKGTALEKHAGMEFPVYLVRYAFMLNGKRYEGRGRVDRESYAWLSSGSSVRVYVDTSSPERNFLQHEYDLRIGRLVAATRLAAGAFMAAVLLALFPRLPAWLWARCAGRQAARPRP